MTVKAQAIFDDINLQRLYEELRAAGKGKATAVRIVQAVKKRSPGETAQAPTTVTGGGDGELASAIVQQNVNPVPERSPSNWVRANQISREIPNLLQWIEAKKEGYRVGVLGETGSGKTSCLKILMVRKWNGITLVHDGKPSRESQFSNLKTPFVMTDVCSLNHLRGQNVSTVIFRGNPQKRTLVSIDKVADLAIQLAQLGVPVRLVIDELDSACSEGGMKLTSEPVRFCITQGRALGLSVLWSTQMPMRAPAELIDNTSVLIMGRMGPKSANYLEARQHFATPMMEQIQQLKTHYEFGESDGPGELCVQQNGKQWNQLVYLNE